MSTYVANALELEAALIRKYAFGGPSYTCYPASIRFQPAFAVEQYTHSLRQQCCSIAPLSLCVHLPFSAYHHEYGDSSPEVTEHQHKIQDYRQHLAVELELQAALFGAKRPVTQLHWSGGMASYLAPAEMTELMHCTASHFNLLDSPSRDYSIAIDPWSANKETLALLKGLGFNHIRIAIEIFGQTREQLEEIRALVYMVRNYAFYTLSFDVSYKHRKQSIETFQQTLAEIIALQPDRITLQDAAHRDATLSLPLASASGKFCCSDRLQSLRIMASQTFTAHGYILIGMQHFVRAHDAMHEVQKVGQLRRNLLGYCATFADDLVGVGLSASSKVGAFYTQNTARADEYYLRLHNRELPIVRGCRLSEDEQLRHYVIMQIACNLRLNFTTLLQRFDVVFVQYFSQVLPKLRHMKADGLLHLTNDELLVTAAGKPMLRNICMLFDTSSTPTQALVQSQTY